MSTDESGCESLRALVAFAPGANQNSWGGIFVNQGLYRTKDPMLGECARVRWSAGDGAPFLRPEIYEAVRFQPLYDSLPTQEEYESRRRT
jgi:hypothetical protein